MKRIRKALTLFSFAMLVFAIGCGHPTTLQSITISPSDVSISGPGASLTLLPVHLTAFGHFIHPTEVVDITNDPHVTWSVDFPAIANVSNLGDPGGAGIVTPTGNGSCGIVTVTATAHKGVIGPGSADAIIIGQSTVNVIDTNQQGCP